MTKDQNKTEQKFDTANGLHGEMEVVKTKIRRLPPQRILNRISSRSRAQRLVGRKNSNSSQYIEHPKKAVILHNQSKY